MPLRTVLCDLGAMGAIGSIAALLLLGPGAAVAEPSENGAKARRARPAPPSDQVEDMTVSDDVGFVFAIDLGAVPGATYVQVLPGELPAGTRTALIETVESVESEAAPLLEPVEVQTEALSLGEEAPEQQPQVEEQDFAEAASEITFEEVAIWESSGEPAEELGTESAEESAPADSGEVAALEPAEPVAGPVAEPVDDPAAEPAVEPAGEAGETGETGEVGEVEASSGEPAALSPSGVPISPR